MFPSANLLHEPVVLLTQTFALATVHSQTNEAQTPRTTQFENEDVKVWKTVVMPNAPLNMHRHEHPRVIITLIGGTIKIVAQDGKSEDYVEEMGRAYWLPANAPHTMHSNANTGDKPIVVIVIELEKER